MRKTTMALHVNIPDGVSLSEFYSNIRVKVEYIQPDDTKIDVCDYLEYSIPTNKNKDI